MNLETICDSLDNLKKLVLVDDCFSVVLREKVLSELCCYKGMAVPVDAYRRLSENVSANSSIVLFDNKLDVDPNPIEFHVRGFITYVNYPTVDSVGVDIDDSMLNVSVKLTNSLGESYSIPIYLFLSMVGNPITTDMDMLVNKVEIVNDNDFMVFVEALLVLVHKDGVNAVGYPGC